MGKLQNTAISVGGWWDMHLKVEKYVNETWEVIDDFPFAHTYISDYSMVNLGDDLYLFGKLYLII